MVGVSSPKKSADTMNKLFFFFSGNTPLIIILVVKQSLIRAISVVREKDAKGVGN